MNNFEIKHHYNHWLPSLFGAIAVTFGRHIFYKDSKPEDWLVRHEEKHVDQYILYGTFGFLYKYITEYLAGRIKGKSHRQAYRNISLEVEARAAELRNGRSDQEEGI